METILTIAIKLVFNLLAVMFRNLGRKPSKQSSEQPLQPGSPSTNSRRGCTGLLRWFLVGITSFLALPVFSGGHIVAALLMLLAIAILLPPLDFLFRTKLPLLQNGLVKAGLWIVLFLTAISLAAKASPRISEIKLCSQVQAGACQSDAPAFVKNTPKLYLSAASRHIQDGAEFKIDLKYTPEPNTKRVLESQTLKASIKDNKLALELKPKALPIGRYQLSMASTTGKVVGEAKTFTVWDSEKDLKIRMGNTLPTSEVSFSKLRMCSNADSEKSTIEGIDGVKLSDQLTQSYWQICSTDSTTFKRDVKTLNFWLGTDSRVVEPVKLRIIWKYLKNQEEPIVISDSIKILSSKVVGLNYTLNTNSNLMAGNYELIIALETRNAVPIYRKFTVE